MKVEKGVPMPVAESKYPFSEMEIGDSFAVDWKVHNNARQAAWYYASRNKPWGFKTKRMNGKLRIWRTK
jgi:hypothetical protein